MNARKYKDLLDHTQASAGLHPSDIRAQFTTQEKAAVDIFHPLDECKYSFATKVEKNSPEGSK